jgi:UrcA family protein
VKTLIAILVATFTMGAASAAEDRIVIHYSDVDLTTPVGAQVLYRRIVNASHEVCHRESVLGVYGFFIWRKCVQDAISGAVSNVDNPLVTAQYHGHTPSRLYSSRAMPK